MSYTTTNEKIMEQIRTTKEAIAAKKKAIQSQKAKQVRE